jgi:hypothetical protein
VETKSRGRCRRGSVTPRRASQPASWQRPLRVQYLRGLGGGMTSCGTVKQSAS